MREPLTLQPRTSPTSPEIPGSMLPPLLGRSQGAHQPKGTKGPRAVGFQLPKSNASGTLLRPLPCSVKAQKAGGRAGRARPHWSSEGPATMARWRVRWMPEKWQRHAPVWYTHFSKPEPNPGVLGNTEVQLSNHKYAL